MTAHTIDKAERIFFADLQKLLTTSREIPFRSRNIARICAVDAAYNDGNVVAVATEFTDGGFSSEGIYRGRCTFPYVSGLFYLREGPAAVEAVRRLRILPHLVCFDAHGAAHPRRAGLATIAGMMLGIPSIGIAKSPLLGKVDGGTDHMMSEEDSVVGLVTGSGRGARYWSPGYSVKVRDLRSLIVEHGRVCLQAMATSHRRAREEASASSSPLRPDATLGHRSSPSRPSLSDP